MIFGGTVNFVSVLEEESNSDLELQEIPSEEADLDVDDAPYKIRTYGADYSLELYSQKIDSSEIRVPEFQRRYVWTHKKASKLIESFLLGLPVPQIFLYQEANNLDFLVVDGQQRLLSVHYFLRGTLEDGTTPFTLRSVRQTWEGKTYSDLEEIDKRRLRRYILRATIFEQIDPADHQSVYEIFERLNSGGMPLTGQEVRNCVNNGAINAFLQKLNENMSWRALLGNPNPDRRMKDIELILRVLALIDGHKSYKKPMKDFINEYMKKYVDINEFERNRLELLFESITEMIANQVGVSAFRLAGGRLNVAVLDSVMTAVGLLGSSKITDFKLRLEKLKAEIGYLEYVSTHTTDETYVQGRIKMSLAAFQT